MIALKEVDKTNWIACIRLSLPPDQASQLASNVETIAESKFKPHYHLRAICSDHKIVGMLAYCQEIDVPTPDVYWLFRLMIDHSEQRKGHARKAIELACTEMAAVGATTVMTMHKPANVIASRLYRSAGFQPTGQIDDGDIVLTRHLLQEE